jgi:hypothetical protein
VTPILSIKMSRKISPIPSINGKQERPDLFDYNNGKKKLPFAVKFLPIV